jgi:hypothetical protein
VIVLASQMSWHIVLQRFSCCPGLPYSAAIRTPNSMVVLICSSPSPSCVVPNTSMALALAQGLSFLLLLQGTQLPSTSGAVGDTGDMRPPAQHCRFLVACRQTGHISMALFRRRRGLVALKLHLLVLPLSLSAHNDVPTFSNHRLRVSVSSPPLPSLSHEASYPLWGSHLNLALTLISCDARVNIKLILPLKPR